MYNVNAARTSQVDIMSGHPRDVPALSPGAACCVSLRRPRQVPVMSLADIRLDVAGT